VKFLILVFFRVDALLLFALFAIAIILLGRHGSVCILLGFLRHRQIGKRCCQGCECENADQIRFHDVSPLIFRMYEGSSTGPCSGTLCSSVRPYTMQNWKGEFLFRNRSKKYKKYLSRGSKNKFEKAGIKRSPTSHVIGTSGDWEKLLVRHRPRTASSFGWLLHQEDEGQA